VSQFGLTYDTQDVTAFADAIKNIVLGQPGAPITLGGPIDTTITTLFGTSPITGTGTPVSLDLQMGIRHAFEAGEPQFGITSSASVGYVVFAFTVDPVANTWSASLDVVGATAPAFGTASEYEAAGKKIAFELITMKAASDGWQDGEFENLLSLGEQWGIYDASVVTTAQNMMTQTDSMAKSLKQPMDKLTTMIEKVKNLEKLSGLIMDFYVNIHTTGSVPSFGDVGLGGDAPVVYAPDDGATGGGIVGANWHGGPVGKGIKSLAGGGMGGAWSLVGDRPGGGFVPGVSELMFGNAHVFDSKTSEKMLKSGLFGKVRSLAFGSDDGGYTTSPIDTPGYTPPSSGGGGGGGKANSPSDGSVAFNEIVQQFESDQQAMQNEVRHLCYCVPLAPLMLWRDARGLFFPNPATVVP